MINLPIHLHEFEQPQAMASQHRRAFVPISAAEARATYAANAGQPMPTDHLPADKLIFDASNERIPVLHIPADGDSAFDTTPRILLNAGSHGDEHEPVHELANMIETRALPRQFAYDVVLNLNPHGYRQNTRENAQGHDINRSFFHEATGTPEAAAFRDHTHGHKYVSAIDMHEDFEAEGCYSYEDVAKFANHKLGTAVVNAWQAHHIPLQPLSPEFDLGPIPGTHELVHRYTPGSILANPAAEMLSFGDRKGMMLTTQMLLSGQAKSGLRIESGQTLTPATRRVAQRVAVLSALRTILENPEHFAKAQVTMENVDAVRAIRDQA